jgi:RNA-directed DNA polymerase
LESAMITEPKNGLVNWHSIEWNKVNKIVRNLRHRIYRATPRGEWKQVKNLEKLTLRSLSNTLLSVRRVTHENQGKDTPGIDGMKSLTPEQRVSLVNNVMEHEPWKAKPARRVDIPKANGKKRPLGIPIIKDRVMQAVVKNALEPEWEARFEANSYGFRPGVRFVG